MGLSFRKILVEDQPMVDKFIAKCPTYQSDYSIATLILWTEFEDIQICITENAVYIKGYVDEQFVCLSPLCALDYYPTAFKNLQEYCRDNDELLNVYYCTKEQMTTLLQDEGFNENEVKDYLGRPIFKTQKINAINDRNLAEYCYLPEHLINLAGQKLQNKKHRLALFHKTYDGRYEMREMQESDYDGVRQMIINWNQLKGYDYHEELNRIQTLIENRKVLGIEFHLLIIDGQIAGMTMFQKMANNIGLISFEKCDSNHLIGFSMLNWYEAVQLKDCTVINRQEDLGLKGLRMSKMTYQPVCLVEKYTITENREDEVIPLYKKIFGDSDILIDQVFSDDCQVTHTALNEHAGKIVSCGFVRNKGMRAFTKVVDIPFIFGIATDEQYRHQGRANNVMTKLMRSLYYDNCPIAMLCPANDALYKFYGDMGFEKFNFTRKVPLYSLFRDETVLELESMEAAPLITEIFNRHNTNFTVTQYRTEEDSLKRISEVVLDGGHLVILHEQLNTYGYLFIDEDDEIIEVVTDSIPDREERQEQIIENVAHQFEHFGMSDVISKNEYVVVPVEAAESTLDVNSDGIMPSTMVRIINPQILMMEIVPQINLTQELNVNFIIKDSFIKDSRFNLKTTGGKAYIDFDIDPNGENLEITIQEMAEWLLGRKKVDDLPCLLSDMSTVFYEEW